MPFRNYNVSDFHKKSDFVFFLLWRIGGVLKGIHLIITYRPSEGTRRKDGCRPATSSVSGSCRIDSCMSCHSNSSSPI
jgi:hypothetical protein